MCQHCNILPKLSSQFIDDFKTVFYIVQNCYFKIEFVGFRSCQT